MQQIKTLGAGSSAEVIIERSRFIAILQPFGPADNLDKILQNQHQLHPKANHICYAYILSTQPPQQKFSDAGEPNRTAGMPMLNILQHEQLSNCLAIAIRYFGGIKLGTGGLARAYAEALKMALAQAKIQELQEQAQYRCQFDYTHLNSIKQILAKNAAKIQNIEYTTLIQLSFFTPAATLESIRQQLNQVLCQEVELEFLGTDFV